MEKQFRGVEGQDCPAIRVKQSDGCPAIRVRISGSPGPGPQPTPEVLAEDVNLHDYDGTILHAYTRAEFLALTELPANPTRPGLTAQGWNWTLAEAQDYVREHGYLTIGQSYVTDDGATRIFIETVDRGVFDRTLYLNSSEGCTIDWGDGSSPVDVAAGAQTASHTYPHPDEYMIEISYTGTLTLGNGASNGIMGATATGPNIARICAILKVECGPRVTLNTNALASARRLESVTLATDTVVSAASIFADCPALHHIVIPRGATALGTGAVSGCSALICIGLPPTLQAIAAKAFSGCSAIAQLSIPDGCVLSGAEVCYACTSLANLMLAEGTTAIGNNFLRYDRCAAKLVIPATVTSIGTYAFDNLTALAEVYIYAETPPTLASNAFNNTPSSAQFYVPAASVELYQAASNWSAFASRIHAIPT